MRKSLLLLLILALTTAFAVPAKTLVVNLTASGMGMKAGTSYIDDENSFSVDNVSFAINHFIPKADCTQVKVNQSSINNNIYIYNTTALPNITRIEFEMTAAALIAAEQAAQTYVYSGTSCLRSLPACGNVTGTI